MKKFKVLATSLSLVSVSAYASQFSVIMYSANDPFIKNYAQELENLATLDKQDLHISFSQSDIKVETLNIQKAFSENSSALIVNPVDPNRALQISNLCFKNKKTPIIYINRKPSNQSLKVYKNSYFVGTDASEAGRFQADILNTYCQNHNADKNGDGKISYVLLEGQAQLDDTIMRSMSLRSSLSSSPLSYEEVEALSADWKSDKASYELNQFINTNGIEKIEAIVSNNDAMALGALSTLQSLGYNQGEENKYIPIVGVDGSAEALAAIADGKMTGTVKNDHKSQAAVAYKIAKLAVAKEAITSKTLGRYIDDSNCVYIPYLKISATK